MGLDIGQKRLFAQVIPNHVGNAGIDALVVGHTGTRCIDQADISHPKGREQSANAQHGIGPKRRRIEKIVVDAAVDDVHAPQPLRRAHVHEPAVDQQILALNQFYSHLAGKKHVLVEGRVVDPG